MVTIIDTTLREGEQTPGIHFSRSEKKHIINGLTQIGIQEIELGIASRLNESSKYLIDYCRKNHPDLICSLWSRCLREDIMQGTALKPDILSLSIPVSAVLLTKKLGKTKSWAKNTMVSALDMARDSGLTAAIGFEDATRAEESFVLEMADLAGKHGAVRLRLADTVGISSPIQLGRLVAECKKAFSNGTIGIHCHNDFGMATANAVAAVESGAEAADATILWLGERSGCARLEELAGYLSLVLFHQFRPEEIRPLADYVALLTKRKISPNRPLLGKDIFTCETGLHLEGLQKDPTTYEPFSPHKIGRVRQLIMGEKTGRNALRSYLRERGYSCEGKIKEKQIRQVRRLLQKGRVPDKQLALILAS